jgi:hypothetical protein
MVAELDAGDLSVGEFNGGLAGGGVVGPVVAGLGIRSAHGSADLIVRLADEFGGVGGLGPRGRDEAEGDEQRGRAGKNEDGASEAHYCIVPLLIHHGAVENSELEHPFELHLDLP